MQNISIKSLHWDNTDEDFESSCLAHRRAWLQFEVEPQGTGSLIRQTAIFDPVGLLGLIYWYAIYPIHTLIFRQMLRAIAKQGDSI